jgi:hypothetical protein
MRLRVLSDLHLEFGMADVPAADADVVVLAGDIHLGREGRRWARRHFPETPVVYVLGNHEYYRHSLPGLTELLQRECDGSHIHLLENARVDIEGFTFLGCTLWTDFQLGADPEGAMRRAESEMNDYSMIRLGATRLPLRASDTLGLHTASVSWLRSQLAACNPARTIVVTHHSPSPHSEAPYHTTSPLKAAFASNLDPLIGESRVRLWVHGHTHFNVDYNLGSTRVLTNQRGYPDQPCGGFDPRLVIEI